MIGLPGDGVRDARIIPARGAYNPPPVSAAGWLSAPPSDWRFTLESHYFRVRRAQHSYRLHFVQWGETDNPCVVVCAHGLTRNARDFDTLARSLAGDYRVLCIDFAGRGKSDWLTDKHTYSIEHYAQDCAQWLDALQSEVIHWVGTSMGGLVGIELAADDQTRFASLVLNDVGPEVPSDALQRIAAYLGNRYRFKDQEELEFHLRFIHAPFGALSDDDWRHLARHSSREAGNGELTFHYDPDIVRAFEHGSEQGVDLWERWRRVNVPMLLLRGETSDVLTRPIAERMLCDKPQLRIREIAGVGHAPALMADDQVALIHGWLKKTRLK